MFVSTESTSSHEFATQFGLDIFYMGGLRKKHPKLSSAITEWPAQLFILMKQRPAIDRQQNR